MSGGLEWTDLAQRQVASSCEHGSELWRMTYVGNPLTRDELSASQEDYCTLLADEVWSEAVPT